MGAAVSADASVYGGSLDVAPRPQNVTNVRRRIWSSFKESSRSSESNKVRLGGDIRCSLACHRRGSHECYASFGVRAFDRS